ncbi:MAG: hypothetical protein U9N59_09290, partial [Campylobacterota bacterium]|nr:hypothetical protein [Campylobacterota bacterium]
STEDMGTTDTSDDLVSVATEVNANMIHNASAPTLDMNIGDVVETVQSSTVGVDQFSTGTENEITAESSWGWSHNVTTNGTDADDHINYTGGDNQTINGGAGDDYIDSTTSDWTHGITIDGGAGNDYIEVGKAGEENNLSKSATVSGGTGDDTISFKAGTWDYVHEARVDGGAGNDKIFIAEKGNNSIIDGGADNDVAVLTGSKSDYQITNNSDGSITVTRTSDWQLKNVTIKNVETLEFTSGETMTLDSASSSSDSSSASTYSYEITLNAGLTDTDGSESLSSITVDNIPTGATIDGLTANLDGSYTVPVDANGDATVSLVSSTEISTENLNSITSSITSTESDGGDTSTVLISNDDTIDLGDLISANKVDVVDLDNGADQSVTIDLQEVIDITDSDNDLVFVGDDGDVIDFNDNSEWTKSDTTTKVDGVDGDFNEYVSTTDASVSVFVEDDVTVTDL